MRTFKEFLEHEKRVLLNNIERLQKGLERYQDGDSMAQGHQKMIAIQKRHIAMLGTLLEGEVEFNSTLATCREALKLAEHKHQQLVDQSKADSELWWETLDVIQFLSNLIYRIEDWKRRYYQS
jgi:hypothetical protein